MKSSLPLFFALFLFLPAFAQEKETTIVITESPSTFLFPDFTPATILLKSGLSKRAAFNYNMLTQEMVYQQYGRLLALDMGGIDTIYLGERKFIPFERAFLEVAEIPPLVLFIRHQVLALRKGKPIGYGSYTNNSATTSLNYLSMEGTSYNLKVPADYKINNVSRFWIREGQQWRDANSLRQLKTIFPEKKEIMKKIVREHDLDLAEAKDMIKLLELLRSE